MHIAAMQEIVVQEINLVCSAIMLTKSCMCMHVLCASVRLLCEYSTAGNTIQLASQVHLSRSNAVSCLRYLNKALNLQIYKK